MVGGTGTGAQRSVECGQPPSGSDTIGKLIHYGRAGPPNFGGSCSFLGGVFLKNVFLQFFQGERGTAYLVFWAFMLPMLLVLIGLGTDLSRVQAVQTKLQTATDSAALAAVQTAQPVVTYGYIPQYDSQGNLIDLQKVITSDTYEVQNAGQAQQAADSAFNLNMQNMVQGQDVTVTNTNGQIYSRRLENTPANQDSYTYWANVNILTFYLGPAMKLVDPLGPDYTRFPVSVVGTASVSQPVQGQ